MARKNDGIIWHLMDAPWWVSILFSAGIYVGLSFLLPDLAARSDKLYLQCHWAESSANGTVFCFFAFLFLIPAPITFFKQYLRKHNYLATTS